MKKCIFQDLLQASISINTLTDGPTVNNSGFSEDSSHGRLISHKTTHQTDLSVKRSVESSQKTHTILSDTPEHSKSLKNVSTEGTNQKTFILCFTTHKLVVCICLFWNVYITITLV